MLFSFGMTKLRLPSCLLIVVAISAMPTLLALPLRCLTFLGVVSSAMTATLAVLCFYRMRSVLVRSLLAVSTGLMMQIRCLATLVGTWLVQTPGRSACLLCSTFRNLILVSGSKWITFLSTLRFVCRTGTKTGGGSVTVMLAAAAKGAPILMGMIWTFWAVLHVSNAMSLLVSWWKAGSLADWLCNTAIPRVTNGRLVMNACTIVLRYMGGGVCA